MIYSPFENSKILKLPTMSIMAPVRAYELHLRSCKLLVRSAVDAKGPHLLWLGRRQFVAWPDAVAEGIQAKTWSSRGKVDSVRNPDNFNNAIFFYRGGLALPNTMNETNKLVAVFKKPDPYK